MGASVSVGMRHGDAAQKGEGGEGVHVSHSQWA
jgi:hypothetical protein